MSGKERGPVDDQMAGATGRFENVSWRVPACTVIHDTRWAYMDMINISWRERGIKREKEGERGRQHIKTIHRGVSITSVVS